MDEPRTKRLPLVLGAVAAVSAVIAALVIFSSGEPPPDQVDRAPSVSASDLSLVLGNAPDADFEVVVYEDFACPQCRDFDLASRDFLSIEAGRGDVRVEYRPVSIYPDAYSRAALAAWASVLESGTPKQARALHDVLMDRQPPAGDPAPDADAFAAWAKKVGADPAEVTAAVKAPDEQFITAARRAASDNDVRLLPTVVVNGTKLRADDGTALADRLQAMVVAGTGKG